MNKVKYKFCQGLFKIAELHAKVLKRHKDWKASKSLSKDEKQAMLERYNNVINANNESVEKEEERLAKQFKKPAKVFDLKLAEAIKSNKRYFHHYINMQVVLTKWNNSKEYNFGEQKARTEDLKKLRKRLKRDKIDYDKLSVYELVKEMGKR